MLKIYGSMLCKDCVACRADLDSAGISYEYLDFSENLANLKEFMAMRDKYPIFAEAKEEGNIGIPCIVKEDGTVVLDWWELI